MFRSLLISIVILLCFALFETSILSNILFLPSVPDFLMICVLYLSANNGRLFGVTAGFASGIILDFLTAAPFGFHSLLRTLIGYFSGLLNRSINIAGAITPFIFGLLATIVKKFLILFISLLFPAVNSGVPIFSMDFLFEIVANAILTPILFRFLDIFSEKLLLSPETVS